MKTENFNDLILLDEEKEIFALFLNQDKAFLTVAQYRTLKPTGLLKFSIDGKSDWFDAITDGMCELSDYGKRYREHQKQKNAEKQEIKDEIAFNRKRAIRAECIAFISLGVAILGVIWQIITSIQSPL